MKTFLTTIAAICLFALNCSAQWTNSTNINNTNTGNVGIGTTTPNAKLEIQLPTSSTPLATTDEGLRLSTSTAATNYNTHTSSPFIKLFGGIWNGLVNTSRGFTQQVTGISGTNYGYRFAVGSSDVPNALSITGFTGYVGIGTIAPATVLDAVATTTNTGIRSVNSAAAASTAAGGLLAVTGNPSAVGQRLGMLGFGGTIGDGTYSYASQVVGYSAEAWGTSSGSVLTFRTTTNGAAASTERMRIDNAGNVGIGTTHPDQALTVNGQVHSTSVLIESTVPADYVFNADYYLRPLIDVKAYVDKNHHLPEVPSAAEFKKDGQNLGEMNMTLLKKVEELTLYLIEQQKTNKELQKQIDELKAAKSQTIKK